MTFYLQLVELGGLLNLEEDLAAVGRTDFDVQSIFWHVSRHAECMWETHRLHRPWASHRRAGYRARTCWMRMGVVWGEKP